jgi:NAD(P)-dependent dehydrogenase (short-subunit alcohol dehydrogenase family)
MHYSTSKAELPSLLVSSVVDSFGVDSLIVLGGGSGIGLMITQALAVNGAKVYIVGRTEEKLDTVAREYNGNDIDGEIIPLQGDVSKKEDIIRLYDEVSKREKCLCILVNNAGIAGPTFEQEAQSPEEAKKNLFDPEDATFGAWEKIFRVNVAQIYFTTTAFLPLLARSTEEHENYSGTVINIASVSGLLKNPQHHPAYNASKAAAIHLSRMLANIVAQNRFKIRINSISPGVFPSEMTTGESGEDQKSHIPKEQYDKVPARRPGNEEDIARAVIHLAVNQYINGHNEVVDGGYSLIEGY